MKALSNISESEPNNSICYYGTSLALFSASDYNTEEKLKFRKKEKEMKSISLVLACVMLTAVTGCKLLDSIKTKSQNLKLSSGTPQSQSSAKSYELPFGVKIGGKAAVAKNDICAAIPGSVTNNSEIVVDAKTDDMIIINVFPCREDGSVPSGTKCRSIILIKKGSNKTTLDKGTENVVLPKGTYIMNVVAQGNTARVVFTLD